MSNGYPNNEVETYCEGRQEWKITSPQYPGTTHTITSMFCNDGEGRKLPSPVVRRYMEDVAKKMADLVDWGAGGS